MTASIAETTILKFVGAAGRGAACAVEQRRSEAMVANMLAKIAEKVVLVLSINFNPGSF
jgi:hypothetical protein